MRIHYHFRKFTIISLSFSRIHYLLRKFTMTSLSFTWIHYDFIIFWANPLSIKRSYYEFHMFFCEFTINLLFFSRIKYLCKHKKATFIKVHDETEWCEIGIIQKNSRRTNVQNVGMTAINYLMVVSLYLQVRIWFSRHILHLIHLNSIRKLYNFHPFDSLNSFFLGLNNILRHGLDGGSEDQNRDRDSFVGQNVQSEYRKDSQ